jgi:hypothetical protein
VAEPAQHGHLGSRCFGAVAGHGLVADEVVFAGHDHQSWLGRGGREVGCHIDQGWLGGITVEGEDAATHRLVESIGQLSGDS